MSRLADIRVEWRVADIERTLNEKAERYEVSTLSSDVGSLERALREACAGIAGLCAELPALQDQIIFLQGQVQALEQKD
jgi:hypothetical protein